MIIRKIYLQYPHPNISLLHFSFPRGTDSYVYIIFTNLTLYLAILKQNPHNPLQRQHDIP